MKIKIPVLIALSLLLFIPRVSFSSSTDNPSIYVNGAKIKSETPAFISENRTMIPLRLVANALNLKVFWNGETKTITLKDNSSQVVKLAIGKKIANKNGKSFNLESPAIIKNNTTFVPLRFIASGFGHSVKYNSEYKSIIINDNFQKPLLEKDGQAYDWSVRTNLGTGEFQSISTPTINPALEKGITFNIFPNYFKNNNNREYLKIKKDFEEGFSIYNGENQYNLSGQIVDEDFIKTDEKSFVEVVFFDITGDGNKEILIYSGDPTGFQLKVFLFYSYEENQGTTYILPVKNFEEMKIKYKAVSYMKDGTLKLYPENGNIYKELKWNKETRELEVRNPDK